VNDDEDNQTIFITINPKNHHVELNWFDVNTDNAPAVLITDGPITNASMEDFLNASRWVIDEGVELMFDTNLNKTEGRQQTYLKHKFSDHRRLDFDTGCYSFWHHLVVDGKVVSSGCMRTRSHWMRDMRKDIENKKIRQLFLPGTHDSASYKYNFDPTRSETLITLYSLTQDDDIMSQLVHGVRYIDMRVGYYRSNNEKFWANHGISRLHPLSDVLRQIKEFVDATDEIVILDFQEFPVGFGRSTDIHKQLAFFLFQQLEHYAADPDLTWDAKLSEIWRSGKRIIVAYDHFGMVNTGGLGILWQSVQQRWGKVSDGGQTKLIKFLKDSRANASRDFQTSRPFAEMAELTPELGHVLSNSLGGLRTMADSVNWEVSKLYNGDFGYGANIVAVDFYRATNLVDIAINWNRRKFSDKMKNSDGE
jgi:hypothetical protein